MKFKKFGLFCFIFIFSGILELKAQEQIPELKEKKTVTLKFSKRGLDADQLQSMSLSPLFFLSLDHSALL
jgi:hypothetical protein